MISGARDVRIALGFPNTPAVAGASLGFQIVARRLAAAEGVILERFYVPSEGPLRTRPGGRSLAAVDLVLFSLSYEGDAQNIPAMLAAGGLPIFAAERRRGHPLVVAGGAWAMINPEPVASFFDLILLGEAEVLLAPFLALWRRLQKEERTVALAELGGLPGALVPGVRQHRLWVASPAGLSADRIAPGTGDLAGPDGPVRPVTWEEFRTEPSTAHLDGGEYILELARGCPRRCRFCAATCIYAPLRETPAELLLARARAELRGGERVGLMGLSAGDYTELDNLTCGLHDLGARLSISSLPADFARPVATAALIASGNRTLTIAPETGSEQLRRAMGKAITNEQVIATARGLGEAGLRSLRTYFIIGLPGESEADVDAIAELLRDLRAVLPANCRLSATVNAFVPKPRTPLQRASMAPERLLRERAHRLKHGLPRGVTLRTKSLREARRQAVIARGDWSLGAHLAGRGSLKILLRDADPGIADLTGAIAPEGAVPWGYLAAHRNGARPAQD